MMWRLVYCLFVVTLSLLMGPGTARAADTVPNLAEAPPVVPPAPSELIDLATALRLAENSNPSIGIARVAIQEALARQLGANALLLPSLRAGMNFHLHNGMLQTSSGEMRRVDSRSFYFGGGAGALGTQTVAFPMVQIFSHLGDALFEPLVTRQAANVRRSESVAVDNSVLLDVAVHFLELVEAEAELNALRQSERDINEVVQITASVAQQGLGREADYHRARSAALLLHSETQAAEERASVASAELARLLNLDAACRLMTPAGAIGLLQFVDPGRPLEDLIQLAQTSRPELAALGAEILRKQAQVRQEAYRPLFPTVAIGYSAGSFGGATNRTDLVPTRNNWDNFAARTDLDVVAFWNLQNAGLGNVALANERRAQRNVAAFERTRMLNVVRREVTRAYADSQAAWRQVEIAELRLRTAEKGFDEELRRIRAFAFARDRRASGHPIEAMDSVDRLVRARLRLIQATFAYDRAQFELFVALGQNPQAGIPACAPAQ